MIFKYPKRAKVMIYKKKGNENMNKYSYNYPVRTVIVWPDEYYPNKNIWYYA